MNQSHTSAKWVPLRRNYEMERYKCSLVAREVSSHPLRAVMVQDSKIRKLDRLGSNRPVSTTTGIGSHANDPLSDPLGAIATNDDQSKPKQPVIVDPLGASLAGELDPLSKMIMSSQAKSGLASSESDSTKDHSFEPWDSKKMAILNKYTTSKRLSIKTSFLSANDNESVVTRRSNVPTSEKVRTRLEQLDDFDEGSVKEMLDLSQQDYVKRIDELNKEMIDAWNEDQRVKTLKIVIQCAKLLSDTSVMQFYPSKFVLITDILDTFGRLVYERIRSKAEYFPPGSNRPLPLPENFTPEQVPESAKETCRNWFYKISSIRELLPRFYVEAAILQSYNFLTPKGFSDALLRLAYAARGFGNPLVAMYARCYLCRVGTNLGVTNREFIMPCYLDFLATYKQMYSGSVKKMIDAQNISEGEYLNLFCPALDWIVQCIGHDADQIVFSDILEKCRSQCNSALLLNSIMSAFHPRFISSRCNQFAEMISQCEQMAFPKYLLYRTLGVCVVLSEPPPETKVRVELLNKVWAIVRKLKHLAEYIDCADIWVEYVCKYTGKKSINVMLGDIISRMTPDRGFENFYPQLQSVIGKVLSHVNDCSIVFSLDKFLPFVDMFQKEEIKVDVCRRIAEAFERNQVDQTDDPIIISAMMFVCKTMHDSVSCLTMEDEKRIIGHSTCAFLRRVSYGRDFEKQLTFFVECRSNFANLDVVLVELVQRVNQLIVETQRIVKGNHSKKTAPFVRACLAYNFITIPSLSSSYSQFQLHLLTGQVALLNQSLGQADAFFKAAISQLAELPSLHQHSMDDGRRPIGTSFGAYGSGGDTRVKDLQHSAAAFSNLISSFLSTLLVIPDSPETGVLYLLRALLNVIQESSAWDSLSKVELYIEVLKLLSSYSQPTFIYHVPKVDSNDAMYGCDPKFLAQIDQLSSSIFSQIFQLLRSLEETREFKKQSQLSLTVFQCVVSHGDLADDGMYNLAVNMWSLSNKHGVADTKQMVRELQIVKRQSQAKESPIAADHFKKLAQVLHLQTRA